MIPGAGWHAEFLHELAGADGTQRVYRTELPVVYFDDDGGGWVSSGAGALRSAESFSNFCGYEQTSPTVGICAADGWVHRDEKSGAVTPIVAWVANDAGEVRGMVITEEGPMILDDWSGYEPEGGPTDGATP